MADYVLNRVGAVGIAWGAYSQKAASIATGFNRLGVPVILGPHSSKYRRLYLSRKEEAEWKVMDARKREIVETGEPSPEHLAYVCETKEKAMVMIPKLCIRKNDTPQGRAIKLNHYISLYKKYMGGGTPRRSSSLCPKRCGYSIGLQERGQSLFNPDRLEAKGTGGTSYSDWNLPH
jgi:acetyl-CoA decarbonylase/synthase complex subunit alpha